MKTLLLFTLLYASNLYASETCKLTKAYKDARYDTYENIKKPYEQCKNSMKEAYYWKAVAKCKTDIANNKSGISCGQLVDSGAYATDKFELSHCETFKWLPSDIENHLSQLIEAGSLVKCKK